MARGVQASPTSATPAPALPRVSFQRADEDYTLKLFGVHNLQARSYGFNDFSSFQRPKHYIRYIEPIEGDLARQVEYDMDEQDQEWLDSVNADRKKEQIDTVSYETFEIIMDRLEKEWFDLTKNIPKADFAMPSEDSTCAICDDSEGENSNAIVFCDGCNLAVHQDCYGVPYIPEGQWLCRKCTVSPENPVSCVLCPNEGGAFKQTITGDWVHLLCAIWVPETRVANEVFMEPVTGVDKISKQRWKLKCSICEIKEGACIQCAKTSCFTAFHTTCARKEKLLMPMKSTQGSEPVVLTCYCERHLPKEQQDIRLSALEAERAAEEEEDAENTMLSKSARAYAKTYKPGPPMVPALIINRILNYIAKVQLRKRQEFVQLVARYWSLKREARRGAPLLKRLHLEPWTANGNNSQSDEDKTLKLNMLRRLREDLEKIHEMTTLIRKRESRKQAQAIIIRDTLVSILAPFEPLLRDAFNRIVAIDRTDYFRYPVSRADVPDYFDIVKNPMCWSTIEEKINKHTYLDSQLFKDDINLVIDNAILYNQLNTAYHKMAIRIRTAAKPILEELDLRIAEQKTILKASQPLVDGDVNEESMSSEPLGQGQRSIGDLEPPLEFLQLLTSGDAIKNDTELVLDKNPIESLFSFEFAKFKPPPPPPPPKPTKPKRDRRADLERKRREREAAAAARALEAQYSDMPYTRTRRGTTMAAAEARPEGAAEPPITEPTEEWEGEIMSPLEETASVPPASAEGSSTTTVRRAVPRRRGSTVFPGASEIPPVVMDVDNRNSFKLFDAGWILPPEQRRGGRRPVERQPLPPPKKKTKTGDHVTSRLSVVSTTTSENQTLRLTTSPAVEAGPLLGAPQELQVSGIESMEVDTSAVRTTISEEPTAFLPLDAQPEEVEVPSAVDETALVPPVVPTVGVPSTIETQEAFREDGIQPRRVVQGADGTVIIELLDSPLIRKQKTRQRKEEKKRLLEQQQQVQLQQAQEAVKTGGPAVAGPSKLKARQDNVEVESDLSSLSDIGSEAAEAQGDPATMVQGPKTGELGMRVPDANISVPDDLGAIREGQVLEGGTLVWAKAKTYPWWPAVVFEYDDPNIPLRVKSECGPRTRKGVPLYMVRFFDKGKTWDYLAHDKLRMLGEFAALDDELLSAKSMKQRWKSTSSRFDCQSAYKEAMAEMETISDIAQPENLEAEPQVEEGEMADNVPESDLQTVTTAAESGSSKPGPELEDEHGCVQNMEVDELGTES
ncbi:hypothetical protein AX17_001982 [Amanita inopinata Kibby_2008]|nr:hypothetical protein AX17_001982 [Amanita inopinata Kibby_2008]